MKEPNILYSFLLDNSNMIGKICDLSDIANEIISLHKYKNKLQEEILIKFILTASLIGDHLKEDGKKISIQLTGENGIEMLVIDYIYQGQIRAYVKYNKLAKADKSFKELTDNSMLVVNLFDNFSSNVYQTRVPILHDDIDRNFEEYFNLSQQINTRIMTSCQKINGKWKARAILLQQLPSNSPDDAEDFSRVSILLNTLGTKEFLDKDLQLVDIIYRLFHEEGLNIYEPIYLNRYCNCTKEKMLNILKSFPPESLLETSDNGKIEVNCDFCNNKMSFLFNEIFKEN